MKLVSATSAALTQLQNSKNRLAELPAKIKEAVEAADVKKLTRLRQQQTELQDIIKAQEIILARIKVNELESEKLRLAEQLKEAEQTQLKARQVNTLIRNELDNSERLFNLASLERVSIESRLKQTSDDIRDARLELERLIRQHSEAA
ncbi:MAG: hypothetical protein ABW208_13450 [Pyrinomonadaceae bacterium]